MCTKHSHLTRSCTYNESSYLSSISLVTGLLPAEEPREPGVEFRDKGLGTRGGRFISWSESFIRKGSRESVSLPSTVWLESVENSRPLFGRLELEWRLCRSDGSPLLWPVAKKKKHLLWELQILAVEKKTSLLRYNRVCYSFLLPKKCVWPNNVIVMHNLKYPTDEQLRLLDISSNNNLPSVLFELESIFIFFRGTQRLFFVK